MRSTLAELIDQHHSFPPSSWRCWITPTSMSWHWLPSSVQRQTLTWFVCRMTRAHTRHRPSTYRTNLEKVSTSCELCGWIVHQFILKCRQHISFERFHGRIWWRKKVVRLVLIRRQEKVEWGSVIVTRKSVTPRKRKKKVDLNHDDDYDKESSKYENF